jgi:hypothetical protein
MMVLVDDASRALPGRLIKASDLGIWRFRGGYNKEF